MLLNFSLATYPRVGAAGSPPGTAELWRALLGRAGVVAPLTLVRADGGPTEDVRVQRWCNGGVELMGIMREPERLPHQRGLLLRETDTPSDFVLTLPTPRRVYDLRAHADLGQQHLVRLNLRSGHATFLALMPDAAPALAATLEPSAVSPGQTVVLRVSVPDAVGDHAVWVTAIKPDGSEADWVRAARVIPRGETVGVPVSIALNDPSGRWVVRLKELYTNRMMDTSLVVEPQKSGP